MSYYLTMTSGNASGQTFRVEDGKCLVGRSPAAGIVLHDETVAWEHATLEERGGKLFVQNLSALGTRVKGKRVTDETRLQPRDAIVFSEQCRGTVEQRVGAVGAGSKLAPILAAIVVLALVVVGGGATLLRDDAPAIAPMTASHWRTAHQRLEARLNTWASRGWFPEEGLILFRDAWRMERAQNFESATIKWRHLRSLLLTMPIPAAVSDGRTVAQLAGPTPRALGIVMGWDQQGSSADFSWNSDEAYADALVWFVRKRAEIAGQSAGGDYR